MAERKKGKNKYFFSRLNLQTRVSFDERYGLTNMNHCQLRERKMNVGTRFMYLIMRHFETIAYRIIN